MKKTFLLICLIFFIFFAYGQQDFSTSIRDTARDTAYSIKPGDILEISIYGEPDLTKVVKVSEDGKVNYPFVGEILIAGLTTAEAANKIEALLKEGYFVNPQVNIFVREYAKFIIIGAVRSPGRYELKGNLALIDAIALAGGATDNADLTKIRIERKKSGQEQNYTVDLDTQGRSFLLEPLDKVVIDEYGKVSVLGEVNRPERYYLKKNSSIFDILALAGGAKPNANLTKITITREEAGVLKEYIVDLNDEGRTFLLKSGDAVAVKPYEKISVLGAIYKPGSYDFRAGLTVVDAVALAGGFTEMASRNRVKVIRETKDGKRKTFNVPVGSILNTGDKTQDLPLEEGDIVSVSESAF